MTRPIPQLILVLIFTPTTLASSHGETVSLGLAERVGNLYNWALGIGAMLAFGIIVFGGVLYSASAGNPSRIDEAKKWITSALLGLALLFSTVIILNFLNPRLTTLTDVSLDINPETSPGFRFVSGGGRGEGGGGDCPHGGTQAQNTPNYGGSDCEGFYNNQTALVGNFGDLTCERPGAGSRTEFVNIIRTQFRSNLVSTTSGDPDYCQRNIDRLTTIMIDTVVQGESGYNPNAFAQCSASGRGAFGLFQMNPVNPNNPNSRNDVPDDKGDVPWRVQVLSAVNKLVQPGGERYWEQWPSGYPKLVNCSGPGQSGGQHVM